MSNSNGVITAPVSIADVQKVLGVSDNNIGALCKSAKINKWSKYKPVSYPKLFERNRDVLGVGIDVSGIKTNAKTLALAADGVYEWKYTKPTGGASSPYRLSDFEHYSHNERCVMSLQGFSEFLDTTTSKSVFVSIDKNASSNAIGLEDVFAKYMSYRPAVAIVKDGNVVRYYFSRYKLNEISTSSGTYTFEFDVVNLYKYVGEAYGVYNGVFMMVDYQFDNDDYDNTIKNQGVAPSVIDTKNAISLEYERGVSRFEFRYKDEASGADGGGITVGGATFYLDNFDISWKGLKSGNSSVYGFDVLYAFAKWGSNTTFKAYFFRVKIAIEGEHYPYVAQGDGQYGYRSGTSTDHGSYIMSPWKTAEQLMGISVSPNDNSEMYFSNFTYKGGETEVGSNVNCPMYLYYQAQTNPDFKITIYVEYTLNPNGGNIKTLLRQEFTMKANQPFFNWENPNWEDYH